MVVVMVLVNVDRGNGTSYGICSSDSNSNNDSKDNMKPKKTWQE